MISQVKQNECIHSHMDLADPSHPSSNPLILEMSRSAACEATGRWALIRKMAGSAASQATGDRKSKRNGTTPYHTTASMPRSGHSLVPGYLGTWVPTWVICPLTHWGPHLPIVVGPWGTALARLAGPRELTLVNLAVSPCALGVICT